MKKKFFRIIIAFFLLVLIGTGIWFFFLRQEPINEQILTLYGNVDIRQVELAFNANERIAQILVEEGASVAKGDILALLETRRLQQMVNRTEAQLAAQREVVTKLENGTRQEEIRKLQAELSATRIEAANAEKSYERLRPLAADNLAAQDQVDDARARDEGARARVNVAEESLNLAEAGPRREDIAAARARFEAMKAELNIARKNLEDAHLTAPADAVIQNRILQPGDMASPQRPVFTLALVNPIWVRAYVSQPDLGKIFPGMKADIHTDSYPGKTYQGWVGYISPTAEFTPKSVETEDVRTDLVYQVRIYACNPQNQLRLGMPATVTIALDQSRQGGTGLPDCSE